MIDLVAAGVGVVIGWALTRYGGRVSREVVTDGRIGRIGEAKAPAPAAKTVKPRTARLVLDESFSEQAMRCGHEFPRVRVSGVRTRWRGDVLRCERCRVAITWAELGALEVNEAHPLLFRCTGLDDLANLR